VKEVSMRVLLFLTATLLLFVRVGSAQENDAPPGQPPQLWLASACEQDGKVIIQIAKPEERGGGAHLAGQRGDNPEAVLARNVPLHTLDPQALLAARNGHAKQPLCFICRSGQRAQQACQKLLDVGCSNVVNVEGGTLAWEPQGLPVVRGMKTISIERQVRIAAGSLVLLGAILGWTVHPAFIGLSAFVGAGLVFTGITDTCGMGLLLARMPWNQDRESGWTERRYAGEPVGKKRTVGSLRV
jgi:rhodanese-related sulfurtransferase